MSRTISANEVEQWKKVLFNLEKMLKANEKEDENHKLFSKDYESGMKLMASQMISHNNSIYGEKDVVFAKYDSRATAENHLYIMVGNERDTVGRTDGENRFPVSWQAFCIAYEVYGEVTITDRENLNAPKKSLADFMLDSGAIYDLEVGNKSEDEKYIFNEYLIEPFEQKNLVEYISEKGAGFLAEINGGLVRAGYTPLMVGQPKLHGEMQLMDIRSDVIDKGVVELAYEKAFGHKDIVFTSKIDTEAVLETALKGMKNVGWYGDTIGEYFGKISDKIREDFSKEVLEVKTTIPAYMVGQFINARNMQGIEEFAYGNVEKGVPACDEADLQSLLHFVQDTYPDYDINKHAVTEIVQNTEKRAEVEKKVEKEPSKDDDERDDI